MAKGWEIVFGRFHFFVMTLWFASTAVSLIAMVVGLSSSDEDCEGPIRAWLVVQAAATGALLPLFHFVKIVGYPLMLVYKVTWTVLGCIWAFGDSCSEDFEYGYTATLISVFFDFMVLGVFALAGCICGIAACIGYGLTTYEDV